MKYLALSILCLSFAVFGCQGNESVYSLEFIDREDVPPLLVEIAQTPEEQQKGLMFRSSMDDNRGMIFIFNEDRQLSFWMKNTLIPLSIAYIDSRGTVKEIHPLEPYSEKPVRSRYSVRYALEVNRGYFQEQGIKIGDRIDLDQLFQQIQ